MRLVHGRPHDDRMAADHEDEDGVILWLCFAGIIALAVLWDVGKRHLRRIREHRRNWPFPG